jgi:hypothetical protein
MHCILYLYLEGRISGVSTLNGILFSCDQHKAAYCSCRPAPYSNKEREQYGLHAFHVTVLNHLDQNVKCKILLSLSQLWNLN